MYFNYSVFNTYNKISNIYNNTLKEIGFVEPIKKNFKTKEDAINYAINRITPYLNTKKPKEYGVIIDYNDYQIIAERLGNDTSVATYPINYVIKDRYNIKHPYIGLHGHPETMDQKNLTTTSFSFQDFYSFSLDDNKIESFVVNKKGQYCIFRKKENFIKPSKNELDNINKAYKKAFKYSWANPIEIYKNNKIIHTFYDQQGIHAFWKDLGDKYNFEYYTNFGVYDGIDAYSDYYYPDLIPPMKPTSHKEFKL